MSFRIASVVAVIALAGCGNIAAVKSFSTKFESPADGETANLRVITNGMVRGVPESDCINWYIPGAGVIAAQDGFAHRNDEDMRMPDSKWTTAISKSNFYNTEVRVTAGKPLTLDFIGNGRVTAYAREQCFLARSFTPEPGHNYEVVRIQDGSTCRFRLVDFVNSTEETAVKAEAAGFCKKSHSFM
ncbi:hypothetical protein [Achromobacter sp.]|uniref:hypothetical protein n=1 Tax=Achromobacter sp. TaxID=134375 RepID=UPI0028AE77F0|nr:hypothetical protein [Achromobacter sp.]